MGGQTVYVLTTIVEGGENRPVAVVTDEHVADQWIREGKDNDWIPLELDDIETTSMAKGTVTPFKPKPKQPTEDAMRQAMANLETENRELKELVAELTERLQEKSKKRGSVKNPLLKKADTNALLWRAPEDNGRHDYQPSWDYELNESPDPELAALAKDAAVRVYQRRKIPFELWAVDLNTASHDAVAMYVDGTCGYPVVLIDLEQHRGYEDQFWKSIDHEIKHAIQESEGRENSEEEAEED